MIHSKSTPSFLSIRDIVWFLCLGSFFHFRTILAFPTGPGSCASPIPLMGSLHTAEGYEGGTELSDFGLEVRVDGMTLTPSESQAFSTGYTHFLELKATKSNFKGALIKLYKEGVDTTEFLTTEDPRAQVVSLCTATGTAGVGHISNDSKDSIYSYLRSPYGESDLILEVTAVIENDVADSRWYHSTYILNAVANLPTRSPAPVTNAPVTSSPVAEMSGAPATTVPDSDGNSGAPTTDVPTSDRSIGSLESPTSPPSMEVLASSFPSSVPSLVPSGIPSELPSLVPSGIPSELPSLVPSGIPSELPSLVPSGIPSELPSEIPSELPSLIPSLLPSIIPSSIPSGNIFIPGGLASNDKDVKSELPSVIPSGVPSMIPSTLPSIIPSSLPSKIPSTLPSLITSKPSSLPSSLPSAIPLIGEEVTMSPSTEDVFAANEGTSNGEIRSIGLEGILIASVLFVVGVIQVIV